MSARTWATRRAAKLAPGRVTSKLHAQARAVLAQLEQAQSDLARARHVPAEHKVALEEAVSAALAEVRHARTLVPAACHDRAVYRQVRDQLDAAAAAASGLRRAVAAVSTADVTLAHLAQRARTAGQEAAAALAEPAQQVRARLGQLATAVCAAAPARTVQAKTHDLVEATAAAASQLAHL